MNELDINEIADKYNNLKEIWPAKDKWHRKTFYEIAKFINQIDKKGTFADYKSILNAGSAGNNYGLSENNMLHVDIAGNKIKNKKKYLINNIEKLPLNDQSFDIVICVGSVINYCDPMAVIYEFSRLLRPDSYLILEFEKSDSWEYLFSSKYNKKATTVTTFYNKKPEKLWVYSEKYIFEILKLNNFSIINKKRFHMLSPLIYKFLKNENFSSRIKIFDKIIKLIPYLNTISSNIIILGKKTSS